MPIELIQRYREFAPKDPRTDAELIREMARQPGMLDTYPELQTEVERLDLERRKALAPPLGTEFKRGARRGWEGLKATALGGAALGIDALTGVGDGAERTGASEYLLRKAGEAEERAGEAAGTIRKVEEIGSVGDLFRFTVGGAGEVLPSVGEALVSAAVGAAAGSAAAPGPGTAGGAITGLLGKQALKSLVKKGVRELSEEGIEKVLREGADAQLTQLLRSEMRRLGAKHGGQITTALNSYALSSGEIYTELQREGVDPDRAVDVALLGGVVAAVPDTYLPSKVLNKVLGEGNKPLRNRMVAHFFSEAAQGIGAEAATEGFQELVNVVATKVAKGEALATNPETWNLSDEDYSRIKNAAALGAIGGGIFGGASGTAGLARGSEEEPAGAPAPKKPEPKKSIIPDPLKGVAGVSPQREQELTELAVEVLRPQPEISLRTKQTVEALTPTEANALTVITDVIQREPERAAKVIEEESIYDKPFDEEGLRAAGWSDSNIEKGRELHERFSQFRREREARKKPKPEPATIDVDAEVEVLDDEVSGVLQFFKDFEENPRQLIKALLPARAESLTQGEPPAQVEEGVDASAPPTVDEESRPTPEDPTARLLALEAERYRQRQLGERALGIRRGATELPLARPARPDGQGFQQLARETREREAMAKKAATESNSLINNIDFEGASVIDAETGKGLGTQLPAFHESFDGTTFSEELAETLASEARAKKDEPRITRRATAFTTPEGKVVILGTYRTKVQSKRKTMVAPFGGRKNGMALDRLMAQGFTPIASMRLQDPQADFALELPSLDFYEQHVLAPARNLASTAKADVTRYGDSLRRVPVSSTQQRSMVKSADRVGLEDESQAMADLVESGFAGRSEEAADLGTESDIDLSELVEEGQVFSEADARFIWQSLERDGVKPGEPQARYLGWLKSHLNDLVPVIQRAVAGAVAENPNATHQEVMLFLGTQIQQQHARATNEQHFTQGLQAITLGNRNGRGSRTDTTGQGDAQAGAQAPGDTRARGGDTPAGRKLSQAKSPNAREFLRKRTAEKERRDREELNDSEAPTYQVTGPGGTLMAQLMIAGLVDRTSQTSRFEYVMFSEPVDAQGNFLTTLLEKRAAEKNLANHRIERRFDVEERYETESGTVWLLSTVDTGDLFIAIHATETRRMPSESKARLKLTGHWVQGDIQDVHKALRDLVPDSIIDQEGAPVVVRLNFNSSVPTNPREGKVPAGKVIALPENEHADIEAWQYQVIEQKDGKKFLVRFGDKAVISDEDVQGEIDGKFVEYRRLESGSVDIWDLVSEKEFKAGKEPEAAPTKPVARFSSPGAQAAFANVVKRLAQAGVNVEILQQSAEELAQGIEGGSYEQARNLISLVLQDVTDPDSHNQRVALHEAVHFLFAGESEERRQQILAAIDRLSDADLRLDRSTDERLTDGSLSGPELAEERLAEALAIDGVTDGQGIAATIFRFLKDLYLRAAMAVQRAWFGVGHENPKLALEYMRNRLSRFVNDSPSLTTFFGGPKPQGVVRVQMHEPLTGGGMAARSTWDAELGEVVMEYAELAPDSLEAMEFNASNDRGILYSKARRRDQPERPSGPGSSVRVAVDFAANNAVTDMLVAMYTDWQQGGFNTENLTYAQFLARHGIDDPVARNTAYQQRLQEANQPPVANPDVRPGDFRSESFNDEAARAALRMMQGVRRKLVNRQSKLAKDAEEAGDKLKKDNERAQQLREKYQDLDLLHKQAVADIRELVKGLHRDLRGVRKEATKEGKLLGRIQALGGPKDSKSLEAAVNKLFKQIEQSDVKFTDLLVKVAGLDIDWQETSTTDARELIRSAGTADKDLADLAESPVLLGIVATYAKSHTRELAWLQLRQANDREAVAAVQDMLDMLMSGARDASVQARELLKQVPRQAKAAGKIYEAYSKLRRKNKARLKKMQEAKDLAAMLEGVQGAISKAQAVQENTIGAYEPVELIDGAQIIHVTKAGATMEEARGMRTTFRRGRGGFTKDQHTSIARIIKDNQAWLDSQPVHGAVWTTVNLTNEKLKMEIAEDAHRHIQGSLLHDLFGSLTDKMRNLGNAHGRAAAQRGLKHVADTERWGPEAREHGLRTEAARAAAMRATGVRDDSTFMDLFHDMAFKFWASQPELQERQDPERAALDAWRAHLQKLAISGVNLEQAWSKLEAYYLAYAGAERFLSKAAQSMGAGVADKAIGYHRRLIGHPFFYAGRSLSKATENLWHRMRDIGWLGTAMPDKERVAATYDENPDQLRQGMAPFFTADVIRDFVEPIINMTGQTSFPAVLSEKGEPIFTDSETVQEAWRMAKGDVIAFAEALAELEEQEVSGAWVAEVIDTFQQQYHDLAQAHRERQGMPGTGIPHQLIDARRADTMPAEWLTYNRLDQSTTPIIVHQMSLHANLGRNLEGIKADLNRAELGLKALDAELASLEEQVRRENPTLTGKALERKLEAVHGKEWLAERRTARRNLGKGHKLFKNVETWFKSQGNGIVEERWLMELLGTIAGLIVQGPKVALINTLSLFDPLVRFGPNRVGFRQVAKNWEAFLGQVAGSFIQLFSRQIQHNAEQVDRLNRLGRFPSDRQISWRDRAAATLSQNVGSGNALTRGIIRGSRLVRETLGTGLGRSPGARFATVSPQAPFTMVAQQMHAATIIGVWDTFETLAAKAMEHLKANAGNLNDPDFQFKREHAKALGYGGDSFENLVETLRNYGMTLEGVAREAINRGDGEPLFTDEQYQRLASLARNEISLESNLANTPAIFANNSVLRIATPLLRWGISRMEQLRKAVRNPDGTFDRKRALMAAMKMYGVILPIGLAYAWLMDEYDEEVTGKKSNIRGFGEGNPLLVASERLARVGTFGIAGDVANTVLNFGSGGDLRGLSIDSRTLFMNTTLQTLQALGTIIHQEDATYSTVGRPLLQALGGSGYLQYAQILNNITGIDNDEARVTARINANNYLRSIGRELSLDVRRPMGSTTPTPMRPHVTDMVLSALANDGGGFQQAYRRALDAAKGMGKDDPVDAVKRSYQAYHFLRSVYKTPPSQQEYQRILSALPDDGRRDVSEAVRLVNFYGETIGVTPYLGSDRSPKPKRRIQQGLPDLRTLSKGLAPKTFDLGEFVRQRQVGATFGRN